MNNLRNSNELDDIDESCELKIQALSWDGVNDFVEDEANDKKKKLEHVIRVFGVTEEGTSVSINVLRFKPYFYIKVDDKMNDLKKIKLVASIRDSLSPFIANGFYRAEFIKRKDFYGFTNNKLYKFIKFTFFSLLTMKRWEQYIRDKTDYKLYESNITPFIRFLHEKNIKCQDG